MTVERNDVYQAMWWLEHQRIFFFGAFIFGSLMILTLKLLSVHNGIISASAVLLMLGYAASGVRNKLKVRLDVLGDNLYYLGFLYTLVSLSFSLYTLGKGTADINNLLENFGLAIMTTLSGLALRVFFNQPKPDISEYENTIRLSLTETTANFIAEASKIGTDISTLRTVLNQIITETQDAQRLSNQALSVAVNDQIGLLEHTSNTNQENIEKLIKRMEEIQNSFAQNFDINTNSMKKVMTTSMNHIEKGAQNFTSSFSDVANSVNNLKVSIDSATEIIENWDSSVERILSTDNAIQNNILASSESLNAVQANLITLANSMPELLGKAVSNFENGTINLANQISKNENLINQSWIKLENSISKFTIQMGILVNKIENDKIKSSDQVNVMLTSGSKNE